MGLKKNRANKVFCLGCERVVAIVFNHRFVKLKVEDPYAQFDLKRGEINMKCVCGVACVVKKREKFSVWLQEINNSFGGKHKADSEGRGQ